MSRATVTASATPKPREQMAGVAHELIVDDQTGFVCDLNVSRWVALTCDLLTDEAKRARLAQAATQRVQAYSFDNAAAGMLAAVRHAKVQPV